MSNLAAPFTARHAGAAAPTAPLMLAYASLGVVFGDIGTSPLYTLKTVLSALGDSTDAAVVLGLLSLIFWTLTVVTSIKYVCVAMSVDNDGEGGILALMALLGVKRMRRPVIVAVGLFGAALIYGDGAITPAISVLSALEGLKIVDPAIESFVLPGTVVILLALFFVQRRGSGWIGRAFAPVMTLWFLALALLGIRGILAHPQVLAAIDPRYALDYLLAHGWSAAVVLGAVFLCVTGAEALYADMGHFGARPIRLAWSFIVFPSLLLNYAGQAGWVIAGGAVADNIFYQLCPAPLLVPLVVLATAATIIASQAIITGAFSMTRQAIQLGWLPRLQIKQTSAEGYGQIYVPSVNWLLMAATIAITVAFRKSDNLASAYGIAVSATMLMTSALLFLAMREIWRWPLPFALAAAGAFCIIDLTFFLANLTKIAEGGYVPLLLAALIYSVMYVWHRGTEAVDARLRKATVDMPRFLDLLAHDGIARVPGTAIFLTRAQDGAPPVMRWHVSHNRALQSQVVILRLEILSVPWSRSDERLTFKEIAPGFWRADAHYGFMERPDVPALLHKAKELDPSLKLDHITYYVGHETVIAREGSNALPRGIERLYSFMQRNSAHVTDYCRLPINNIVEIGRQVAI